MRHIPRFYCPDLDLAAGHTVQLPETAAHHARTVLRLRENGEIKLFNPRDGEWTGHVSFPDRRSATVTLGEKIATAELLPDVMLVLAPLKNKDSFDNAIRHAVELGVTHIQLVQTDRTQLAKLNEERLQQQIVDAVQQCGRLTVPELRLPVKLQSLLKDWSSERILLACVEGEQVKPLKEVLTTVKAPLAILIGPEGGFSPEEKKILTKDNPSIQPVSLGNLILRSDTAVAAALGIIL